MSFRRSGARWVLAAACALGGATGCDPGGAGTTPGGTGGMAAARIDPGTPLEPPAGAYKEGIRVLKVGSRPRATLQSSPEIGLTQYVTTRSDHRTSHWVDGTPMDWEEQPNSIAVVRIEPLERSDDGILVWCGIEGMWVGEEDEAGWEDWASEFEAIAGTAMYQMINAQHMPSGRAFSEPEETDTARAVEQAHLHLKTLVPVTFPDVPIGVGGVWEVHDYAEVSGIGMRMQRVFRVKSISGQRVTIETAQRHVGTPGPMPPMGSSKAYRELLVRELLVTGSFEMDLGLVAPIFGELHGETKTRIRVHRDDDWFEVASLANFRHTWEPYEEEQE